MISVVYRTDTGAAVSVASSLPDWPRVLPDPVPDPLPDPAPDGSDLQRPDGFDLYAEAGQFREIVRTREWDATERTLVPRQLPRRETLSVQELWDRFTLPELVALERRRDPAGPATVNARAQLNAAHAILERRGDIPVNAPRVQQVVGVLVDALVEDGVVAAGDRNTRLADLLAEVVG